MRSLCDLIIPCRDEAPALGYLLPRVPDRFTVIVVDNGSTDGTAVTARRWGARVVTEHRPGYGAAVHAGVLAAQADVVAVMDGDGTLDPVDALPLVDAVQSGRCELAMGRRVLDSAAEMPLPARIGNQLFARWLRRQGLVIHDVSPMRVCRTQQLLGLGVQDRRFGYPFELLRKAAEAGWRVQEFPVGYGARAAGTRSKVSGSLHGTACAVMDAFRVLS